MDIDKSHGIVNDYLEEYFQDYDHDTTELRKIFEFLDNSEDLYKKFTCNIYDMNIDKTEKKVTIYNLYGDPKENEFYISVNEFKEALTQFLKQKT